MQHLNACEDKKFTSQAFMKVSFGHQMAPESETRREPKRFPPPIHKWHFRWCNGPISTMTKLEIEKDIHLQTWKVFDICLLLGAK